MIVWAFVKHAYRTAEYLIRCSVGSHSTDPPLHRAIIEKDSTQVSAALLCGTLPNEYDFYTAAEVADDEAIFEQLLSCIQSKSKRIALCIKYGQVQLLESLLEAGTPFALSSKYLLDIVGLRPILPFEPLMERPGALHLPQLTAPRRKQIISLLAHKANLDIETAIGSVPGRTVASIAVMKDWKLFEPLLRLGLRLDGVRGANLLVKACAERNVEQVVKLIAAGVDVNAANGVGLHPAAAAAPDSIIPTLLTASGATGCFVRADLQVYISIFELRVRQERRALVVPAAFDLCVGLQSLELPALLTVLILDELTAAARAAPMHYKWQIVTLVKHFPKAATIKN